MSESETFGLVVIKAKSAGIPCVLSSIPAFKQFRECPGVILVEDISDKKPSEFLNELLLRKDNLKVSIVEYFEQKYSEAAVSEQWYEFISELVKNRT